MNKQIAILAIQLMQSINCPVTTDLEPGKSYDQARSLEKLQAMIDK